MRSYDFLAWATEMFLQIFAPSAQCRGRGGGSGRHAETWVDGLLGEINERKLGDLLQRRRRNHLEALRSAEDLDQHKLSLFLSVFLFLLFGGGHNYTDMDIQFHVNYTTNNNIQNYTA